MHQEKQAISDEVDKDVIHFITTTEEFQFAFRSFINGSFAAKNILELSSVPVNNDPEVTDRFLVNIDFMFNSKECTDKWIKKYVYKKILEKCNLHGLGLNSDLFLKQFPHIYISDKTYKIKFNNNVITIYKDKNETIITLEIFKEDFYLTYAVYDSKSLNEAVRLNDIWNIIILYI